MYCSIYQVFIFIQIVSSYVIFILFLVINELYFSNKKEKGCFRVILYLSQLKKKLNFKKLDIKFNISYPNSSIVLTIPSLYSILLMAF
jgi:hypothetical protein